MSPHWSSGDTGVRIIRGKGASQGDWESREPLLGMGLGAFGRTDSFSFSILLSSRDGRVRDHP